VSIRPAIDEVKAALRRQKQKRQVEESTIIRLHHILMKEYGWIPFDEFAGRNEEMPIELEIPEIEMDDISIPSFKIKGKITIKRKALPIPTVLNLLNEIQKDRDEEERESLRIKRMGKRMSMPRKH